MKPCTQNDALDHLIPGSPFTQSPTVKTPGLTSNQESPGSFDEFRIWGFNNQVSLN